MIDFLFRFWDGVLDACDWLMDAATEIMFLLILVLLAGLCFAPLLVTR